MNERDEVLKHWGVKGMKWGVRKDRTGSGQNGSKKDSKKPGRIREEWNSLSRERQWKKVVADIDKMTTKEMNQKVRRIQMENDLKTLSSKKNIGTSKDKQDYRRRANMSDEELNRKVTRLRTKDSLHRNINEASKKQREIGEKIINVAAPLAIQYYSGKKVGIEDVMKAWSNPEQAKAQAKRDVIKEVIKRKTGVNVD